MILARRLCLALVLVLAALPARADQEADRMLEQARAAGADVRTIASNFTQTKRMAMFSTPLVSTGRFYFRRPDNLRWEYLQPVPSGLAAASGGMAAWEETAQGLRVRSLDNDPAGRILAEQVMAWTAVDPAWLKERYAITVAEGEADTLELVPRSPAARGFVAMLKVSFSPDFKRVRRIVLRDGEGDDTEIDFTDTRINPPLPDGLFEPPPEPEQ